MLLSDSNLILILFRSCRYNFTSWAIQLNEVTPGLEKKLAPTDCRLRPDQHYTELGEYDKVRVERTPGLAACIRCMLRANLYLTSLRLFRFSEFCRLHCN